MCEGDVVQHAHRYQQTGDLERAGQSAPRPFVFWHVSCAATLENDLRNVRPMAARRLRDECRLAGTFRPDGGMVLIFTHIKVDVSRCVNAIEALDEIPNL